MRAKYCKSKNTYTIDECTNCNCPEYWKQGIGYTGGSAYVDNGGDNDGGTTPTPPTP